MIHICCTGLTRSCRRHCPSTIIDCPLLGLRYAIAAIVVCMLALRVYSSTARAADGFAPVSAVDDLVNWKVAQSREAFHLSDADLLAGVTQGWLQIKLDGERNGTFRLRYVPDGQFLFGLTEREASAFRRSTKRLLLGYNASPAVTVNLKRGFFILETEVTRGQFQLFMPSSVSDPKRSDASTTTSAPGSLNAPMTNVTWSEAQDFAEWLGKRVNCIVRLPTEIEWEYAARGPNSPLATVSDAISLDVNGDLLLRTNFPGWIGAGHAILPQSVPTDCGDISWRNISDLCGSVGEWCLDIYDADYHSKLTKHHEHDPWSVSVDRTNSVPSTKPTQADRKVAVARTVRGAAFSDPSWRAAAAFRSDVKEAARVASLGFRIVLIPTPIRN